MCYLSVPPLPESFGLFFIVRYSPPVSVLMNRLFPWPAEVAVRLVAEDTVKNLVRVEGNKRQHATSGEYSHHQIQLGKTKQA